MAVVGLAMACWVLCWREYEAIACGFLARRQDDPQPVGNGLRPRRLAVTVIGIAFSQNYSVERDVRMRAGDSVDIHEYRFP
jgi:cytochrome c-type biogenesis protein CcmF